MKKLRVAVDFDGVIANTAPARRTWGILNLGLDIGRGTRERAWYLEKMGEANYRHMRCETGFGDTLSAAPVDGALESLSSCAGFCDLYVISARPSEKIVWVNKWLEKWETRQLFLGVCSSAGTSKIGLAESLGVNYLIDNDKRHLSGSSSGVEGVLFSPSLIDHSDWCGLVVRSWHQLPLLLFRAARHKA